MAENICISIGAKIAEYLVEPIGQWLCYSCHYNSNIENLNKQKEKLQDARERVQHSVDAASRNGEKIFADVSKWLKEVDRITELATRRLCEIEEAGTGSSNAACLNLKQRHQLSREAKKMAGDIAELLKNGNFNTVSNRPALQEMVPPRNMDYMTLDSRISIMKRIMEALENANINKIGVWGSPGVGKSTLTKEIFKKAKEESLFHELALANVTDNPDLSRIQGEIAEMLDLELDPVKSVIVRAGRLRARLEIDNEKKILVILDDIWELLDLEQIGITPSERCKVLLTSRCQEVLATQMGTEKNFLLDILGEEEAWNLFEKMAGDSIKDDLDLQNEATKIVKECGGLPIALVTVSRALKNKSLEIWKDALVQLRRPNPEHDTKYWSPVHSCIELSYKHLVSKEVKSIFLLCARQGYSISYRDLLRYGFGLRLFYGIDTLEEARNRLATSVNNLQESCLLLQSPHSSEEFYMHDVVRRVATIIASNDHNMFVLRGDGGQKAWPDVDALKICEALSIHGGDHIHRYPNKIECTNLRYFHVQCENRYLKTPSSTSFQGMDKLEDNFFQGMDKLEDNFFQGMDKLEVLSLTNIQLSSLLSLTNLQTLCLDGCKLGDIHGIGELKTLLILSLASSDISNLPREIRLLTCLRLLDLTYCYKLRVIPPNVLSSLVNLEELYMRGINVRWEVEGPSNEEKNASLAELKKLSHLITLEIDIPDANNLPKDLFTEKLERYNICIGKEIYSPVSMRKAAFSRVLRLNLNMSFQLDFGIKMLLKRTEYLSLDEANSTKSVLYELHREDVQQLKYFHIQNNGNIKHIPVLRTPDVAFPILETFVLNHMIRLEEICQGKLPSSSFKNLKVLKVENCEKLRFIFSSSIARGLSLLEELNIKRCNNVGAIFVKEEDRIEDEGDMMLFDRLQTLVLEYLPKLVGFLSTKDSFMADCRETNSEGNHDLQLPLLHHDQVSLHSLQTLRMVGLPKIKQVWSYGQEPKTVFTGLEQLQVLEIEDCGVEEIVAVEGGEAITIRTLVFPRVSTLKFRNLKKLKWFYKGVHVSKWPMLKWMIIDGCEKVKIFASGVVSFEKTVKDQRPSEMSIKQPLFSVDKLSFPSFETLFIWNMDSLEIIFGKLEGQNGKEPQVLTSQVQGQEKVEQPHILCQPLQQLRMRGLPKIKHVWSCGQEPKTVFLQLKTLEISNCGVEEIVAVEGGEAIAIRTFEFPRVSTLEFSNLKRLKWFYKGAHVSKWPLLKEMKIERCEKVEIFASGVVTFEKIVEDQRQSEMSIKQPIFSVDELLFPSLETLKILNMDSLEIIFGKLEGQNGKEPEVLISPGSGTEEGEATTHFVSTGKLPLIYFKNLKVLEVENCQKLRFFSSSSVARGLSLLENLKIKRCNNICAIVVTEEKDGIEDGDAILFHQLQTLVLEDLPELVSFLSTKSSFITDCGQIIAEGNHNLHMPLLHHQVSFPSLQTLHMEGLLKIKHVWSCDQEPKTDFRLQNLRKIYALRCESLKSLFPISVISWLEQLQVLEIEDCGVEEIFAVERGGGEAVERTLVFPQVTNLKFRNLRRLKWFYKGVHVSKWPLLKEMKIERCEKVEIFASGVVSFEKIVEDQRQFEMSIKQPIFSVDELSFPSLETLEISNMDSLEIIFGKLEGRNGKEPQVLTSPGSGTKESGATTHFVSTVAFLSLKRLYMTDLPKIKHVWSEYPKTVFNFQMLQEIHAVRCESLKSLFPTSIISCLEQLQVVEIEDCGVEEIVAVEGGGGGEAVARTLVFPRVTNLDFTNLKRLKWFYKGMHVTKWSMLEEMRIDGCEKVEIFASGFVSFQETVEKSEYEMSNIKQPFFLVDELSFRNLKTLYIEGMDKLEIIGQDQVATTSFSNIQDLTIIGCKKLLHVFQSNLHTTTTTLIQSLTLLDISWCSSLETIFGNMEGQNGKEPQVLIAPSSGTEESVAREDGTARHIEFPILTQLTLDGLPKLKWIFEGVHANLESWPSLKQLDLGECGEQVNKMIWASKFVSSSSSQENQLQTCIQQPVFVVEGTFPNLEILSLSFGGTICPNRFSDFLDPSFLLTRLPNLWKLNIYDSVREEIFPYELVDREIRLRLLRLYRLRMLTHLWKEDSTQPCSLFHYLEYLDVSQCGKLKNIVPSSVSLHNLTGLEISHCHGLINLLTSSTAKTLVQLERMTVIDCKRITEIVAMEDGEANVAITFNKLTYLTLDGLSNLTQFCSGPYYFGFPSLEKVTVRCCPEMKTFCQGVLSTPKLKGVYDDCYRWNSKRTLRLEDDLHTTTRCLWEANQYDTQWLFKERVENSEENEDHP